MSKRQCVESVHEGARLVRLRSATGLLHLSACAWDGAEIPGNGRALMRGEFKGLGAIYRR